MAYLAAVNSSAMTIFIRNKGNVPQVTSLTIEAVCMLRVMLLAIALGRGVLLS